MSIGLNTGINDDKAAESPPASSPKVAPTAGGVTAPGVSRPMSATQRIALKNLATYVLFPGYCELMLDLGLNSYKAVDWVLNALERRGMVVRDESGDYLVTDAGRAALAKAKP